jgi:hypothetical protein
LVLDFILNGSPMTQRLEASPCRFDGVRWLALCPNTGRRVAHLYIGRQGALSRHAYRLKFNSQREGPLRRDKAIAKLKWPNPSMTRLLNSRRSTTGDLRRIPVHEIAVYGLALGGANFGWQWQRQDEVAASIGARVQGDGGTALLVLDFILNGSPMTQRI